MITVLECGRFARDALASGAGEVCAVFRRSLYLRFPAGRYACLGGTSLGHGPLNVRVSDAKGLQSFSVGQRVTVSPEGSSLWRPPALESSPDRARPVAGLDSLIRAAARQPAREGLGGAIIGAASPLLDHARPALTALDTWLGRPRAPVPPRARALIGLGPGLTPSGDDYLGGLMLGLRATGRHAAAATFWRWLERQARGRTSAISLAHLAAAAHGESHEALHACLEALFAVHVPGRGRWNVLLARLDGVGHCSGRDGLAGVVAVARSMLRQQHAHMRKREAAA